MGCRTQTLGDPASFQPYAPFSFIRRARDMGRSIAATFELQYDEKIFGAGAFGSSGLSVAISASSAIGPIASFGIDVALPASGAPWTRY